MELTEKEKQALLQCINIAIKSSQNAINTAMELVPLAEKIASSSLEKEGEKDPQASDQ